MLTLLEQGFDFWLQLQLGCVDAGFACLEVPLVLLVQFSEPLKVSRINLGLLVFSGLFEHLLLLQLLLLLLLLTNQVRLRHFKLLHLRNELNHTF